MYNKINCTIATWEDKVGRTCWSHLRPPRTTMDSMQLPSSLSHPQIVFRRASDRSAYPLHVCSIPEDYLSKVHCICCLCWRPIIMLAKSVRWRPAIICCIDISAMAAAIEDAPLVECAENTPVSTPLVLRVCLIHLAIVHDWIGLCGAWYDRNNCWLTSVVLNWEVAAM